MPNDIKQQIKEIALGLGLEGEKASELADKCYSEVQWRPYGGAKSFAEVDEMMKAQEFASKVNSQTYALESIISNIMIDEEMESPDDRAEAIKNAAEEYRTRVNSLKIESESGKSIIDAIKDFVFGEKREYNAEQRKKMANNGQAMSDGSFPIADATDLKNAIQSIGRANNLSAAKAHIKKRARALGKTDMLPEGWKSLEITELPSAGGFKVYRDADGDYRWLSLSSNAFEDRDKELFTTKALEEAIEYGDKSGERGPLLVYHVPSAEIGQCDFQALAGRFLIESGTFDDTPLGQKAVEYFVDSEEDHQVSIGYQYRVGDEEDGQYDWTRIIERSVTPDGAAANPWTSFKVIGESEMDANKVTTLEKIFGKELASGVIAAAETKTKELEQSIRFKEKKPELSQSLSNIQTLIKALPEDDVRTQLEKDYDVLSKAMSMDDDEEEDDEDKKKDKKKEVEGTSDSVIETNEQSSLGFGQIKELATLIAGLTTEISGMKETVTGIQEEVKALKVSEDEKIANSWQPRAMITNERPSNDDSNVVTEEKVKELIGAGVASGDEDPAKKYVDDLIGRNRVGA